MTATPRRRTSLTWRIALLAGAMMIASVAAALLLDDWLDDPLLAGAIAAAVMLPITISIVRGPLSRVNAMYRALAGTVTSYRDGDFAFSLAWPNNDELGELVAAHNQLGDTLRGQREALVQRELLLDTMVQNRAATSCTATSRRASCSPAAAGSRACGSRRCSRRLPSRCARRSSAAAMACSSSSVTTRKRSSTSRAAGSGSTAATTSCSCCATSPSSSTARRCARGRR
jgi:hypothetical protein